MVRLPAYVDTELKKLVSSLTGDLKIFRALLTAKVLVEALLERVSYSCGIQSSEIGPAVNRLCDAWVALAPRKTLEDRAPIDHVIGRLMDLWVPHRNAHLSPEHCKTIVSNEHVRGTFVTRDKTARILFDALSRLCAPAILAGGAIAEQKVERSGRLTRDAQDPFKVFFDTLFIFDPEKADATKSTSDQFIPYLWNRLKCRWLLSGKDMVEDRAARSWKNSEGETAEVVSLVADTRYGDPSATVELKDELRWLRSVLSEARGNGVLPELDYQAIVTVYGLNNTPAENDLSQENVRRARKGVERLRRHFQVSNSEVRDMQVGLNKDVKREPSSEALRGQLERRAARLPQWST